MSAFADTSFLFAFYFPRTASEQAIAKIESMEEAILISPLVRYEFRQAVSFAIWRQAQGQPNGLSEAAALSALAAFEVDLSQDVWRVVAPEWLRTIARAERLATDRTPRYGVRAMDLLHLAFALQLGAREFLTFDENQRRVALAEGLPVGPG